MNQRRHIAVVAAAATLLAAMPLSTVFIQWTWLVDCVLAVGAVAGTGMLVRTVRGPLWAQVLAMAAALLLLLTWLFPSGHDVLGFLPGEHTFRRFGALLTEAGQDMRDYAVPVPDRPGLLFLTTLGVGAVALLVDMVTMGLRRPALAGLPMLAIYSVPVAVHEDSVSFIPFAVGAAGFLWLLVADNIDRVRRFGRRFTGDGRDVDLWEPSPLAAAGRRLAVVGVLAAVLVPALIPGMTGGLISRFGTSNGAGPGFGPGSGSSVNLFARFAGQLNLDKTVDMLTVSTDDPSPYYMTLATASDLTMTGFRARPPSSSEPVTQGLPDVDTSVPGLSADRYRATVTIQTLDMGYLPVYQQLVGTQKLDRSWRYDPNTRDLFSPRSTSRGKKYSFDFVHLRYDPEALAKTPPLTRDDRIQRQYTETPFVKPVSDLVSQLTRGKTTPYAKVQAIYRYLSSTDFTYELTTRGTSGDDIVAFLKNKRGYCEQYAAAMAWLVRVADVPARVALGFARGSSASSPYTLTNRNLHAWTEVYFKGFGWVPFDATPSAGVAGSVAPTWAPDARAAAQGNPPVDDIPSRSNTGGVNPGPDPSVAPHGALPATTGGGTQNKPGHRWGTIGALAALLLLIVLALAPSVRRMALRRRRTPARAAPPVPLEPTSGADPPVVVTAPMAVQSSRDEAHAAWSELLDTMIDFRFTLDPAETPRATAARLTREAHLPPSAAEAATVLMLARERALYARDPLVGAGLGEALRTVRAAIAGRVSLRTRLVATLLPPSVMMRWRAGIIDGYAGATACASALGDAVLRAASPRRLLAGRSSR